MKAKPEPPARSVNWPALDRQRNGHPEEREPAVVIAELEQENARLRRERDLLRLVMDALPDPIYVKDDQSRFLLNNLACAKLMGAAHPDHLINKGDTDFFPKEFAERYSADEQKIFRTGQTLNCVESTIDRQTGRIRWMQTTKIARRDRAGKIIGLIGIGRDITELKQAKETSGEQLEQRTAQLSQERLLLRTLIDNLPDCIYAKDTAGRKTLANPADLKNLNCRTEAEAIGKTDFDLFPKEIAEKFWADDQKVLRGSPVNNREEYFFDNHGRKVWLLTTKLPLRDKDGNITGLIGIGRNITRHKQMELELSYEQQLLQTLLENSPARIYFKDDECRLVRFSQSKAQATLDGMRRAWRAAHPNDPPEAWPPHLADIRSFSKWLMGKTDFDTYPEPVARAAFDEEREVMRTGQPIIGVLQKGELADGEVIWWLANKLPWRDKDGNMIGTFGASLDVTQIKQAEEMLNQERNLLRTLIDSLPDLIYVKDRESRFIVNNLAHTRLLGARHPDELIGKNDFDCFPQEFARQFFADEQTVIQSGQPLNRVESVKDNATGEIRVMQTTKVPRRDRAGRVIGIVGIGHDITELKQAEAALRANEEKLREFAAHLERSNRELQDFAYVASHDLQEPLRKIVVFGERLKEKAGDRLDTETLDYLQRMQKAAQRMQNLINDLLTFSRVTTRAQPFSPVDLARTAGEVLEDLEARIEMTKGRVELGNLPTIEAEPLQMRQLIQNLLGNALKFRRPETPPVVKIDARIYSGIMPQAPPGVPVQQLCELTVSDNGIGFEEKYLDRIFNVFQRLHTRGEYEGTGMGLAIARKIVLHHGGAITAKSAPDRGATFLVTLPVSHPKLNPHPQ